MKFGVFVVLLERNSA